MAKEKILIVDDEEDILKLVDFNLSKEGYSTITATSGEQAVTLARRESPGLIVLDLMLPGVDGLDVCRLLKMDPSTRNIPIVILTAKGEDADIVTGLELGADDYITKPFSPRVLIARVKAALRRTRTAPLGESDVITYDELVIDPGRYIVTVNGEPLDLTYTEFRILHCLARRPGWVFTRYQIVENARGEDSEVTDRSVDVHIVSLRRKLGSAGRYIDTVRGVGYKFKE